MTKNKLTKFPSLLADRPTSGKIYRRRLFQYEADQILIYRQRKEKGQIQMREPAKTLYAMPMP